MRKHDKKKMGKEIISEHQINQNTVYSLRIGEIKIPVCVKKIYIFFAFNFY